MPYNGRMKSSHDCMNKGVSQYECHRLNVWLLISLYIHTPRVIVWISSYQRMKKDDSAFFILIRGNFTPWFVTIHEEFSHRYENSYMKEHIIPFQGSYIVVNSLIACFIRTTYIIHLYCSYNEVWLSYIVDGFIHCYVWINRHKM